LNFNQFLEDLASKYKNRTAVTSEGMSFTYAELLQKSKEFAFGLKNIGFKKGDKAGLLMYNRAEFVISFIGTIMAGGIVVPINPFLVPEEIEYIFRHSESSYFITSNNFSEYINYVDKNIEDIKNIIACDQKKVQGKIIPFNNIFNKTNISLPKVSENDPCAIMYSSGTEGALKGALFSSKNLISNGIATQELLKLNQNDKVITFLPLFHPFSITVGLLTVLAAGATILLVDNTLPFKKLVKTVFIKRATIFIGIPQVFNLLSSIKTSKILKFINPVRFCISGGSPLPIGVLQEFEKKYKIPIIEGYGLLEAGPVVSVNPSDPQKRKAGSVGKVIPNVKAVILNLNKKRVKLGEIGEIAIKGDGVMLEYYKDPEATKRARHKGWFLTGDMGKFDNDGFLYIIDRKSDIISSNGKVFFSRDLEELLHDHPAIEECAVVGIGEKQNEKFPVAIVVLKNGKEIETQGILNFLNENNADYLPKNIEFWEELPRSSTGKVLKREIIRLLTEK
jgi:long-chain acyl-CoA synthetase